VSDTAGLLSCDRPERHARHTWTYRGVEVDCHGEPAEERGRCCSDPLCPCAYKPGWGPYTDSGRPSTIVDVDYEAEVDDR